MLQLKATLESWSKLSKIQEVLRLSNIWIYMAWSCSYYMMLSNSRCQILEHVTR